MESFAVKSQQLVALCLLGILLFNYPLLALFNLPDTVFGIPLLYAYIFCAWTAFTAVMAYVVEKRS